jgi:hypothetical protein
MKPQESNRTARRQDQSQTQTQTGAQASQSTGEGQRTQVQSETSQMDSGKPAGKSLAASPFGSLADSLPQESREKLEHLFEDSKGFLTTARSYVAENPAEAAGLMLVAGGILWAVLSTKPGAKLLETGKSMVKPAVDGWVSRTFNTEIRH